MLYFSAVGKVETTEEVIPIIEQICKPLVNLFTMRSGGAKGADLLFTDTYKLLNGKTQIFLPWSGYNNQFDLVNNKKQFVTNIVSQVAFEFASGLDDKWEERTEAVKVLDARNVHIYLGEDIGDSEPSKFVLFFDDEPNNKDSDTQRGLLVAQSTNIPAFNLYTDIDQLKQFLQYKHGIIYK